MPLRSPAPESANPESVNGSVILNRHRSVYGSQPVVCRSTVAPVPSAPASATVVTVR